MSRSDEVTNWWIPTSPTLLQNAELKLISHVPSPVRGHYVKISGNTRLWTLSVGENTQNKNLPLVLVHGMGSGVGMWALNLDGLSQHRPVHAMDVLGFGQSSRLTFSCDATEAEEELVASLEEWRVAMNLDKIVLLGHSFGGFLGSSYAIKHPNRVAALILADPWGFPELPKNLPSDKYPYPSVVKAIDYVLQYCYPWWGIRAVGPLGPSLVRSVKIGIQRSFRVLGEDVDVAEYAYHLNALPPSGEIAFHSMKASFGWAKRPMVHRLGLLDPNIPLTFIYGKKSWVDQIPATLFHQRFPNSRVDVEVMEEAGHDVFCDNHKQFNELVLRACASADAIENGEQ